MWNRYPKTVPQLPHYSLGVIKRRWAGLRENWARVRGLAACDIWAREEREREGKSEGDNGDVLKFR